MSLRRRLIQILGLGRGTTAATDGGFIRTVQAKFLTTGETRDGVPFMQHYGFASRPHASCDYAVIALDHQPGKSVIIASNDQRYRISLVEGEVAIHDDQAQSLHLTRAGVVATDKSGSVISMLDGSITLAPANGIVNVTGKVVATGSGGVGMTVTGSLGATGDVVAGVGAENISLISHQQQNGGGTGLSGPPQPNT